MRALTAKERDCFRLKTLICAALVVKPTPQQSNGVDCGLYVVACTEALVALLAAADDVSAVLAQHADAPLASANIDAAAVAAKRVAMRDAIVQRQQALVNKVKQTKT